MKRKAGRRLALSVLFALALVLGLLPGMSLTAYASETEVEYLDDSGSTQTAIATPVTSSDATWSGGWYVVDSDLVIGNRITVSGMVNLILCDGVKLDANAGIAVENGNTLNIYEGWKGERDTAAPVGELSATGRDMAAGIGSTPIDDGLDMTGVTGGNVTINGGTVTATGGTGAAGIGGGARCSGGNVTINGGTVTATGGGNDYGAIGMGIGKGYVSGDGLDNGTLTLGKGVKLETSSDDTDWTDTTSTTGTRTRYMRTTITAPAHTHSFTYDANGATITATCNGEGTCDITEGLALTIIAPTGELVYDGTTTFPATLSEDYNATAFPGTYPISYTKDGSAYDGEPREAGSYTASVTVGEGDGAATASVSYVVTAPQPEPGDAVALTGSGHVQKLGDVAAKASGKGIEIGTTHESRRLEQFSLALPKDTNGSIEYRAHLQGKGWGEWSKDGAPCGTTHESRRIEAVQLRLTGALAGTHSVWYRVHSQTFGWLGWAKDGQAAGTAGQAKRAEAIDVQVLPQGEVPEGYVEGQASYVGAAKADVHVQRSGWAGARSALEFGTTGQSRRLEAIRLSVPSQPEAGGISYEVHAQGKGWMTGAADGALAGTTGQSRRLEAVRVSLTGDMAKKGNYSVWYRVHSQTYGWLGWAHDGDPAGTTGLSKRAEAIDVQVLPQGQVPRGYDASKAACVSK